MESSNRVLAMLRAAIAGYEDGPDSLEALRDAFSHATSLLEGDVPRHMHVEIARALGELNDMLYTTEGIEQMKGALLVTGRVKEALDRFESVQHGSHNG